MRFVKMHGCGNDYIYINGLAEPVDDPGALAVRMSRAHFGVGADGLILILPSDRADFRMRMFNSDGSEGRMCGNGARCVGRFVYEQGLTRRTAFTLETGADVRSLQLTLDPMDRVQAVTVDMGAPEGLRRYADHTAVSFGSPHRVYATEEDPFAWPDFAGRGLLLCQRYDANIEFVQVLSPDMLRMRVWERGSGETLACGSGACASVAAMQDAARCGDRVTVEMRGGSLDIERMPSGALRMTGPAETVFIGEWADG